LSRAIYSLCFIHSKAFKKTFSPISFGTQGFVETIDCSRLCFLMINSYVFKEICFGFELKIDSFSNQDYVEAILE